VLFCVKFSPLYSDSASALYYLRFSSAISMGSAAEGRALLGFSYMVLINSKET